MVLNSNNSHSSRNNASFSRRYSRLDRGTNSSNSEYVQVFIKQNPHKTISLKVAMWNIKIMLEQEKLENIKSEMNKCSINILSL